jgi:hypothetical protein
MAAGARSDFSLRIDSTSAAGKGAKWNCRHLETMVGRSEYGEGAVRIRVAEPGGSSRIFRNTFATSHRMVSAPSMMKTRLLPIG